MNTIDIRLAKKRLSRLVDHAAAGGPFVISKNGKPLVKVVPLNETPVVAPRIFGFMTGRIKVPDDFDRMGEKEIEELFGG